MNRNKLIKLQVFFVCLGFVLLELGLLMMWDFNTVAIIFMLGMNSLLLSVAIEFLAISREHNKQ